MRTSTSPLALPFHAHPRRWGLALVAVIAPSMGCTDSHAMPDAPAIDTAAGDAPLTPDAPTRDAPVVLAMDTAPELDAGVDAPEVEDADLPDGYYPDGVRG